MRTYYIATSYKNKDIEDGFILSREFLLVEDLIAFMFENGWSGTKFKVERIYVLE